jgi:hypothetical protein
MPLPCPEAVALINAEVSYQIWRTLEDRVGASEQVI